MVLSQQLQQIVPFVLHHFVEIFSMRHIVLRNRLGNWHWMRLECGMCLGEGTGAVIGAKLFDFALAAYEEVADFHAARVVPYQPLQ